MERFYSIGALSQSMERPKKGNNVSNVLGITIRSKGQSKRICKGSGGFAAKLFPPGYFY